MTSPRERYQRQLLSGKFRSDPVQQQAVEKLEHIYQELTRKPSFLRRILPKKLSPPKGLYLWGGVGIGKTWLMDIFFQSLPSPGKKRLHFHHFMKNVHENLKKLQGKADPLALIAKQIAKETPVMCFDELLAL